jgi:hypothetical protein
MRADLAIRAKRKVDKAIGTTAISLNAAVRSSVSRYQSNQGGSSGGLNNSAESQCSRVGNEYRELKSSESCEPRTSLSYRTCRAYSRVSLVYRIVGVPASMGASCST